MDPNATLARIRQLRREITLDAREREDEAAELAELTHALDEWLSRGGYLPTAWDHGRYSADRSTSRTPRPVF